MTHVSNLSGGELRPRRGSVGPDDTMTSCSKRKARKGYAVKDLPISEAEKNHGKNKTTTTKTHMSEKAHDVETVHNFHKLVLWGAG